MRRHCRCRVRCPPPQGTPGSSTQAPQSDHCQLTLKKLTPRSHSSDSTTWGHLTPLPRAGRRSTMRYRCVFVGLSQPCTECESIGEKKRRREKWLGHCILDRLSLDPLRQVYFIKWCLCVQRGDTPYPTLNFGRTFHITGIFIIT